MDNHVMISMLMVDLIALNGRWNATKYNVVDGMPLNTMWLMLLPLLIMWQFHQPPMAITSAKGNIRSGNNINHIVFSGIPSATNGNNISQRKYKKW